MYEKKKKRGQYRWMRFILLMAIYAAGFGGAVLIYLAGLAQNAAGTLYPAPPEQVSISVHVVVEDAKGQPVLYRSVQASVQVDTGDGDGFVTNNKANSNLFRGTFTLDSASTGCVWGSIEIEGYPRYEFEYGLANIEWGVWFGIVIIVAEDGIESTTAIMSPTIKPAVAPVPVMYETCPPQIQYPLSVTPLPAG